MVENCDFLKRLRNVHLEKSAVTGLFYPSCSPTTAKTPLKVHLRLRFQNLGKPRTAGLCGQAAGACDCGPLSCTKIERPSLLEKPSCKVRLFAQIHFHEYRQKVTVTTLFQTAFHRVFQLLPQTAHVCFYRRKRVHTRLSEKDRTQRHTRRNRGRFGWGRYYYPRSVLRGSETLRGRVSERRTLPLWGLGRGHSRRTQKACGTAMRLCASLSRGVAAPLGCVILFRFCRNCGLYALRSGAFRVCEARGGITTLSALYVLLKRRTAACQNGSFAVF